MSAAEVLDPRDVLDGLALSADSDAAFWILTSAGAHLNGYDLNDGDCSTAKVLFWNRVPKFGGGAW